MTITEAMIEQSLSNKKVEQKTDISKKLGDAAKIFWDGIKSFFNRIKNNKEKVKIFIPVAVGSVCIMLFLAIRLYLNIRTLNSQALELFSLSHFSYSALKTNTYTKDDVQSFTKVKDLITYNTSLQQEKWRYQTYLDMLQSPYTYLLQYLYLPRLNIRKDPYTAQIDTALIWLKYLEKNPYNDITLIEKWTSFFKNVGESNESNTISDIVVGDITEDQSGFFKIPITVSFTSPSKRSFLLLVDKLSLTSNSDNISLINEFIYYLRNEIKTNKTDIIKKLKTIYNSSRSDDQVIGYHLFNWVSWKEKNQLIDPDTIQTVIKESVACEADTPPRNCFYMFRDKYRGIPSMAYTIGDENTNNKVEQLKEFLSNLTPVMSLKDFSFDRNPNQNFSSPQHIQYQGKISIEIYGKWISDDEITEIWTLLGKQCFNADIVLDPTTSMQKIEETLLQISDVNKLDTTKTKNLWDLKDIIQHAITDYPTFTNYQKTIKLFELYRMLHDANVCKV